MKTASLAIGSRARGRWVKLRTVVLSILRSESTAFSWEQLGHPAKRLRVSRSRRVHCYGHLDQWYVSSHDAPLLAQLKNSELERTRSRTDQLWFDFLFSFCLLKGSFSRHWCYLGVRPWHLKTLLILTDVNKDCLWFISCCPVGCLSLKPDDRGRHQPHNFGNIRSALYNEV